MKNDNEMSNETNKNRSKKIKTAVTFTAEDLTALARYIGAGVVLLQTDHPVIPKIKAALSRLGLATPKGL